MRSLLFSKSFKKIPIKIIFILGILLPITGYTKHTVGGEMTYTCLGNGDYLVDLIIYRDCSGNNTPFDNEVSIAIFSCGNNTPCTSYQQGDQDHLIRVPIHSSESLPPVNLLCLETSFEPCLERGRYLFKLSDYNILLNQTVDSYHLVYQRCCRNESISNLNNPDENGNTYTIEITPLAQELCNNSPKFDKELPSVICANRNLNLQQFITDPDGDSLVYKFTPVIGGGGPNLISPEFNFCTGALPTPPCPPPFEEIEYRAGFNSENPLGMSDEPVAINPISGVISGVPTLLGQFVFGIEVMEYRDGNLLGTIHREFQFNVLPCEATSNNENCAEEGMTTATHQLNKTELTIYPNPVKEFIRFHLNTEEAFRVSLLTIEGKILFSNLQQKEMNMSNFPAGLYLAKVELLSSGQVFLNKILLSK